MRRMETQHWEFNMEVFLCEEDFWVATVFMALLGIVACFVDVQFCTNPLAWWLMLKDCFVPETSFDEGDGLYYGAYYGDIAHSFAKKRSTAMCMEPGATHTLFDSTLVDNILVNLPLVYTLLVDCGAVLLTFLVFDVIKIEDVVMCILQAIMAQIIHCGLVCISLVHGSIKVIVLLIIGIITILFGAVSGFKRICLFMIDWATRGVIFSCLGLIVVLQRFRHWADLQ